MCAYIIYCYVVYVASYVIKHEGITIATVYNINVSGPAIINQVGGCKKFPIF